MLTSVTAALPDLVELIYDCALNASLWPHTLERIKDFREATATGITLCDPIARDMRSHVSTGLSAGAKLSLDQTYAALLPAPLYDCSQMIVDGIYSSADLMRYEDFRRSRFFLEWAEPNGVFDSSSSCLMKSPSRFAMATCMIPRMATPRDRTLGRLLAPHIRRAVTIADLMDAKRIEIARLEATLDTLTIGVLVTDEKAAILLANHAAEAMLAAGAPIAARNGILQTQSEKTTLFLRRAILRAAAHETELGACGIGVPLPQAGGRRTPIHILPLERRASGALKGRRQVAVFVGDNENPIPAAFEIIAALHGLTPAEVRVLGRISQGESCEEISRSMSVAVSTVRTHMNHLLSKTGMRRQAELVRLVERFSLPVQGSRLP